MTRTKMRQYRVELKRTYDSEDFRSSRIENVFVRAKNISYAQTKARAFAKKKSENGHDYDITYCVVKIVEKEVS